MHRMVDSLMLAHRSTSSKRSFVASQPKTYALPIPLHLVVAYIWLLHACIGNEVNRQHRSICDGWPERIGMHNPPHIKWGIGNVFAIREFLVDISPQLSHDYVVLMQILHYNPRGPSSHARTVCVLEILGRYSWSTKVIIVLAALAKCYGKLWLILQFCATNPLASSLARLKRLGNGSGVMEVFRRRFKALRYLSEKMVDVAKCIAEFEILPEHYVTLDFLSSAHVKVNIHKASYWAIRSSVACASQICGMTAMNSEQMQALPLYYLIFAWTASKFTSFVSIHMLRDLCLVLKLHRGY